MPFPIGTMEEFLATICGPKGPYPLGPDRVGDQVYRKYVSAGQ